MVPLNEYEARQADEIAAWKAERPSLVMAASRVEPAASRLAARVVPHGTIRGARRQGRSDVGEVRRTGRDCPHGGRPRHSRTARPDTRGMRPPGRNHQHARPAAGDDGGGHRRTRRSCHRDAERSRALDRGGAVHLQDRVLLPVLHWIPRSTGCSCWRSSRLSTADEPARRQALFQQLKNLGTHAANRPGTAKPVSLDGVEEALFEDPHVRRVPIVGDVTSILIEYDSSPRRFHCPRVFQAIAQDHGRSSIRSTRRPSGHGGEAARRRDRSGRAACYLGRFGVSFGVTSSPDPGSPERTSLIVRWSGRQQGADDPPRDAVSLPVGSARRCASTSPRADRLRYRFVPRRPCRESGPCSLFIFILIFDQRGSNLYKYFV